MRKTSVYLTEDEAEGLRRLAAREGRPQAELIREGVRRVIAETESAPRTFRSLALGRGGREAGGNGRERAAGHAEAAGEDRGPGWSSDELYRKAMGEK